MASQGCSSAFPPALHSALAPEPVTSYRDIFGALNQQNITLKHLNTHTHLQVYAGQKGTLAPKITETGAGIRQEEGVEEKGKTSGHQPLEQLGNLGRPSQNSASFKSMQRS